MMVEAKGFGLVLCLLAIGATNGQTFTWNGGDWTDGQNFDVGVIPNATADVVGAVGMKGFAKNTEIEALTMTFSNGEEVSFENVNVTQALTEIAVSGGTTKLQWTDGVLSSNTVNIVVGDATSVWNGEVTLNNLVGNISIPKGVGASTIGIHLAEEQMETQVARLIAPQTSIVSSPESPAGNLGYGDGSGMKIDALAEVQSMNGIFVSVGYSRFNTIGRSCHQPTEISGTLIVHGDMDLASQAGGGILNVAFSSGVTAKPWCTDENQTSHSHVKGTLEVDGDVSGMAILALGQVLQSSSQQPELNKVELDVKIGGSLFTETTGQGAFGVVSSAGMVEGTIKVDGIVQGFFMCEIGQSGNGNGNVFLDFEVGGDLDCTSAVRVAASSSGITDVTAKIGGKVKTQTLEIGSPNNEPGDSVFVEIRGGAEISSRTTLTNATLKMPLGTSFHAATFEAADRPTIQIDVPSTEILLSNQTLITFTNESIGELFLEIHDDRDGEIFQLLVDVENVTSLPIEGQAFRATISELDGIRTITVDLFLPGKGQSSIANSRLTERSSFLLSMIFISLLAHSNS